jgi:hypothetical protein
LVLRSKLRNPRGDFEAQITKPELPVLRPKPENPPPPWFWGSTKKPIAGFEAKLRETVTTSFEVKMEKTVTTGFEAKLVKTVATSFEAKLAKTVKWFWGQTTHKSLTLVLKLNQEISAPHFHVAGADRTRRHPTSATISGPLHQVSYSCHDPRHCTPCRTCHLHTTRQVNTILQTNKDKRKTK